MKLGIDFVNLRFLQKMYFYYHFILCFNLVKIKFICQNQILAPRQSKMYTKPFFTKKEKTNFYKMKILLMFFYKKKILPSKYFVIS